MSDEQRLSVHEIDPNAYEPMFAMEKYIHGAGLGEDLLALIKIRASQINGCAYCLDMHGREARTAGVDNRRIDVVAGWREASSLYSEREQAALALTEQVTLIGQEGVSESVWSQAAKAFGDKELVAVLMAICAINVWNRLAVSTHQALPDSPPEA